MWSDLDLQCWWQFSLKEFYKTTILDIYGGGIEMQNAGGSLAIFCNCPSNWLNKKKQIFISVAPMKQFDQNFMSWAVRETRWKSQCRISFGENLSRLVCVFKKWKLLCYWDPVDGPSSLSLYVLKKSYIR